MKTATIRKDTRLATERKKIMRKVRATEGKHQGEPTCDNCDMMTIRQSGSGNHRHCDLMGLYIPDNEQSPSCDLHSAISKFERMMTEAARRNKKGGGK